MKCEEFESIGLDLDRETAADGIADGIDALERAAAIEHANTCPRCAALQESWQDAQIELQALRELTRTASAPLRVEMRIRQEFRTRHRTVKTRAYAITGAWVLATAALLIVGMSWWNWHLTQENISLQSVSSPGKNDGGANQEATSKIAGTNTAAVNDATTDGFQVEPVSESTLVAANDAEDFTLLPGSLPQESGDGAVVRVRLQRGALGALGLPVNEERAAEWIQVDLFVGQDGQPQAVRLPQ